MTNDFFARFEALNGQNLTLGLLVSYSV